MRKVSGVHGTNRLNCVAVPSLPAFMFWSPLLYQIHYYPFICFLYVKTWWKLSSHFYSFSQWNPNSSKNQLLVWSLNSADNEMHGYLLMSKFSNCFRGYCKSRDQAKIQIRDLKPKNILTSQDPCWRSIKAGSLQPIRGESEKELEKKWWVCREKKFFK